MSVNLYRLYAVQNFKGQKVAVYVNEGNYPDAEILNDAQDIVDGTRTRAEVMKGYTYNVNNSYPDSGALNRQRLTYFTRVLKRSQKVLDENYNVDKAIFVWNTNKKEWRGERTLYDNKLFDTIKCDTPEYTGCTPVGTIII